MKCSNVADWFDNQSSGYRIYNLVPATILTMYRMKIECGGKDSDNEHIPG